MNARIVKRHAAALGHAGAMAAVLLGGSCAQILGMEELRMGASLASLVVSGIAPTIELVPDTTEYVVDLPLLQQSVTVTATVVEPGDTLSIAGRAVASGEPSPEIPLNLSDNPVDIVVENELGWQRTYHLTLRRGGARLAQYAYGKASNTGAEDALGRSVALSGDTLAVGARFEDGAPIGMAGGRVDDDAWKDTGAVYVFRRTGTTWAQEAYLKASNAGVGDSFGDSVALSGDTLAIGARLEDSAATGPGGNPADEGAPDSGAVYVFRRTGTRWEQEAYLKASNTAAGDDFGVSVALSGDILAVGARYEDSAAQSVGGNPADEAAPNSGAVYVFRRTGTTWKQEAYLKASNAAASDQFGRRVALSGDTLAVGAPDEDSAATGPGSNQADESAPSSGAVYVFRRTGTTWKQEAYLKASNTGAGDSFGETVAVWGDTLAVGALFEDSAAVGMNGDQADDSLPDSGTVYVFRRTGTSWEQEAYLKASNTDDSDSFGGGVALWGDMLAVTAVYEDSAATGPDGDQADNNALDSGAVYVFHRLGTSWEQEAYLKASNTDDGDYFGSSVALSSDALAIGAWGEDSAATGTTGSQSDDSAPDSGAVYIFH